MIGLWREKGRRGRSAGRCLKIRWRAADSPALAVLAAAQEAVLVRASDRQAVDLRVGAHRAAVLAQARQRLQRARHQAGRLQVAQGVGGGPRPRAGEAMREGLGGGQRRLLDEGDDSRAGRRRLGRRVGAAVLLRGRSLGGLTFRITIRISVIVSVCAGQTGNLIYSG